MIVCCQKCQTRFQLDDARVPEQGIRVRCSHCKHAFFIRAGSADEAEVIDELASQAAASGQPSTPEVTHDPPEEPGRDSDDESDWQFNQDTPQEGAFDLSQESSAADPFTADESDYQGEPEEFDREALGHPDGWEPPSTLPGRDAPPAVEAESGSEWDGDAAGDEQRPHVPALDDDSELDESSRIPALEPDEDAFGPPTRHAVARIPLVKAQATPAPAAAEPLLAAVSWAGRIGRGIGWLVVSAIFAAGVYGALTRTSSPREPALDAALVAGLEAEEVAGAWFENAHAGPIYVVTGTLRNASGSAQTPGEAVQVALLGARGEALDVETAAVGLAVSGRALHEEPLAALRQNQASSARGLAWRSLAAGERYRFQAIFAAVPPEAARFRLEAVPVPAPVAAAGAAGRE